MNDMAATIVDFDTDSHFAYSVMANIAIMGDCVPESMMNLYLEPCLKVADREVVLSSLAYFHGSDILKVQCDCPVNNVLCLVSNVTNNEFHASGIRDKEAKAPMYNRAVSDVMDLRQSIF